ncbi:MAG: right-handed parallel beta-helix repeat-containing protein [Methanospirillum sp.]|uniref:NosD domain-containing protein n=1 Tax=Methanospirillum sp. TaxID=45200 RepID=UPI00237083CC|nr:NosD domain-containing protein [Methanospirillum sp.]MDD1727985.1 right-handed parallel beta-helix repeat-containing protein [Methanospirillum sp.]
MTVHTLVIVLALTGFFGCVCADNSPVTFPPADVPYTGDYVYITEPGRYTLEHNISHQYPVGIIIAAPSVILDGQGYTVQPANPQAASVGIWISLTDSSGGPVTGVTIRNVSIGNEGYGVYTEEVDSTLFPWGKDRGSDPAAVAASSVSRNLILSSLSLTTCHEGMRLVDQDGAKVSGSLVSDCTGSGITVHDGSVQIQGSQLVNNHEYGALIMNSSGSEISSSRIERNEKAGISLEGVKGIHIFNNLFDNNLNIEAGTDNQNVVLATERNTGENILGGMVLGGNYWASGGTPLLNPESGSDIDGDGIGDTPYDPGFGVPDPLPLVRPVEVTPTTTPKEIISATSTPTPTLVPVQTPKSIMSGIHAVITGDTIPDTMQSGQSYQVVLTLTNDGSDDWLEQYKVGIMTLDDTAKYGPEWMAAPASALVRSGESKAVPFTFRAPAQPGTYTLKYQAGREGTGVQVIFGRAYTKTVTVT